ncbi:MAG: MBL fold metallo-hydrolase [Deltaproteobacteria bacterium]|nr:MBL fold metallo-hydrolase [Deltaproteobacteria bacterium]
MSKLNITFVGHATFLIDFFGARFLTDANFSKKVLFVPRQQEPGINPRELPDLDAMFITHAHYDHLDLFSYKYFSLKTPLIVPLGLGKFIKKHLPNPVIEIPTWGEVQVGDLRIFSIPVKHRSFRLSGLAWRDITGYVIEKNGYKILFPGDTAYGDHFKQIANLHQIDVALLPIGAYEPRWIMKNRHMNPSDALKAFQDLKAKYFIPYHFGAFRISTEALEEPLYHFEKLCKNESENAIHVLKPGERFECPSKI